MEAIEGGRKKDEGEGRKVRKKGKERSKIKGKEGVKKERQER